MRKIKSFFIFIFIIILTPMLCSCTGYTELENMDILTSHFVYKNSDTILLGGGVANVRNLSDSMADTPVNFIAARGTALHDAAENLRLSSDHRLFYGSIRALVIGEEYARGGIGEFLDYISALPDCRTSVNVFTSSTAPELIVGYKAVNDFSGGFAAESIVRTLHSENQMINCTLSDIWEARVQKQVGFAVPDIEIDNDIMSISGYSIFDREAKLGTLAPDKGAALNYITAKSAKDRYYVSSTGNNTFAVDADMKKKKLSVYDGADGVLHTDISLVFDLEITPPKASDISNDTLEFIKSSAKETLHSEISDILSISKEYGCDFLKLYKAYQTKNRSKFDTVDWRGMISGMSISADVSIGSVKIISAR